MKDLDKLLNETRSEASRRNGKSEAYREKQKIARAAFEEMRLPRDIRAAAEKARMKFNEMPYKQYATQEAEAMRRMRAMDQRLRELCKLHPEIKIDWMFGDQLNIECPAELMPLVEEAMRL